jgi:hypothetical protein
MPDGSIGVDAAVVLLIELRADRVAMKDPIVWRARENAQSGILRAVGVLHAKVAIEGAVMAGEEANALPASLPREGAQCADFRLCHEHETRPLHDVGCDRVVAVSPHAAHHARLVRRPRPQTSGDQRSACRVRR